MLQATSAHDLLLPLLGLRRKGLLQAVIQPLLLTASLFMGPLLQSVVSGRPDGDNSVPLQTLRNLLMAPITEEFCFRACMAPLFSLQVNLFPSFVPQENSSIAAGSVYAFESKHCHVLQAHVHSVMH